MAWFTTQNDIQRVRQKLAAKDAEISAAEARRRERALEVALSDDPAAGRDLLAEMSALAAERQLLIEALAAAEGFEAERAEAARTEQARRQAEAEARARKASFEAGKKHLQRWEKACVAAQGAIGSLATAYAQMVNAADKFDAVLTEGVPWDAKLADGTEYRSLWYGQRVFELDRSSLLQRELARAGAALTVDLPGADTDGVAELPPMNATAGEMVKALLRHAKAVLLDEPKAPPSEPTLQPNRDLTQ